MLVREELEQNERRSLSPYASHAADSSGRETPEDECDIRTCYMRDRDRIVHCKSFRRLKDKTQVFLSPRGDHYRTRMMHTLEVSQTASLRTGPITIPISFPAASSSVWPLPVRWQ